MVFDPACDLVLVRTDLVERHSARASLEYARRLLAGQGREEGERGETGRRRALRIIRRALDSQVLESGHPHRGAFRFFDEDDEVTGLNVVSFVLQQLYAIWTEHYVQLSDDLRALILERVRLALGELERMDVQPRYTNAALMDIANSILWGQILDDQHTVGVGRSRLNAWIAFTAHAGAPYEYSSPSYLAVDLNMLSLLACRAEDAAVRLKARVMAERIWLHAILHYHAATGRLAGPHSRAYHSAVHGAPEGVLAMFWRQLGTDAVWRGSPYQECQPPAATGNEIEFPAHLCSWAHAQAAHYPYTVRETAHRPADGRRDELGPGTADLATYFTASYCLGTASRNYTVGQGGFDIDHQGNHCILYYRHRGPDSGWRTLYTRFVVNDRYYGAIEQHALRTKRTNFYDQGLFAGHQHRNAAIALYGLELLDQGLSSVEALVVMPGPVRPDAIYAGEQRLNLNALPVSLPEERWLIVADGEVLIGIWPLRRDQMGSQRDLELRLLPTGELVVAMPHYRGQEKWFWEYASPRAAFYRRNIRSGFLLVVGERSQYATVAAFRRHLARAQVIDELDAAGVRTVGYQNEDAWLEMRYDLVANEIVERRIAGEPFQAPALKAPWTVQTVGRQVTLGEATLDAGAAPALLFARDGVTAPGFGGPRVWEAMVLGEGPQPVRLRTPCGEVRCDAFGFGTVRVEAAPGVAHPTAIHVRCTGTTAPVRLPATGTRNLMQPGYALAVEGTEWVLDRPHATSGCSKEGP